MESIHGRNRHETVTGCDETCELPPCDHQSRRDTTPLLGKSMGAGLQAENAVPHDWFDEASRAIREKIEDKGSGRSSGKHAHVVTCTSPLQRTSEPKKDTTTTSKENMGRTAEYVRCPSAAVHHTSVHGDDRSTPLRMSIVDRTGPSTAGMVDGHHGSWTRHQGRNLDGTRVVVRQQRRLIALDMGPCGLPGSSHVVNALRCESVVVDACAR